MRISDREEWVKVVNDLDLIIVTTSDGCMLAILDDEYQTMIGAYCYKMGYLFVDKIKSHGKILLQF